MNVAAHAANSQWDEVRARFRAAHGRDPRALHVTNIANNAYNNAKLLARHGLGGDVVCPDYYHIMACPEWEDADFHGEVEDHFAPHWWGLDLRGFERPRWFAQGPLPLCLAYLEARHEAHTSRADALWWLLGRCNGTLPPTGRRLLDADAARIALAGLDRYLWAALCPDVVERKVQALLGSGGAGRGLRTLSRAARGVSAAALQGLLALPGVRSLRTEARALAQEFARAFPQRRDVLSAQDVWYCARARALWQRVLGRYDIVIGYGIGPIAARIAGYPCFAMEHGTLREIPFEDSAMGRLTALGYRAAEHVFVTNLDCMPQAYELAGDRVTFVNHPFDEHHGQDVGGSQALREELCARLDAEFLCFFPTRHDWVAGTGYADKGNDELLRAFGALRRSGRRVGLVCCRWGRNVADSERLLAELGVAAHVAWYEPMGMVRFERMAKSCDVVADQFRLGAFGGVVFKSLAVGAPVCTFLDQEQVSRAFPEPPPVLNCRGEDEIRRVLSRAMDDPGALAARARASRAWMLRYHAGDRTAEQQLARFAGFLAARLGEGGG